MGGRTGVKKRAKFTLELYFKSLEVQQITD